MPRPRGSQNTRPSRKAVANYYQLLKNAANEGDTLAAAKLIELHHMTNDRKETANATQN